MDSVTADDPAAVPDDAWEQWSEAADAADNFGVALAMIDAMSDEQRRGRATAMRKARLLLLCQRPSEALAVLSELGVDVLPATGDLSWAALVLAACRAATGDRWAYQWLLAAVSRLADTEHAAPVAYLVAAAAEQIGDSGTGDQVWTKLVADGRITPVSIAKYAAAAVASRDRDDEGAVARTLASAAIALERLVPPPWEQPVPVVSAADDLSARGDQAGARLLLHAVLCRNAPIPLLQPALDARTPIEAMRRHRARMIAIRLACVTAALTAMVISIRTDFLAAAAPAVAAVALGFRWWSRRRLIPGLSRADSGAWKAFDCLRHRPTNGRGQPLRKDQGGLYGVGGIAGLVVAMFVAGALSGMLRRGGQDTAIGWVLLLTLGWTIGYFATRALHRYILARRRQRRQNAADQQQRAAAAHCRCWQDSHLSGAFATAYLREHLADCAVPISAFPAARLERCPVTGALWLALVAAGPSTILLRSQIALPNDQPVAGTPDQFLGMYL